MKPNIITKEKIWDGKGYSDSLYGEIEDASPDDFYRLISFEIFYTDVDLKSIFSMDSFKKSISLTRKLPEIRLDLPIPSKFINFKTRYENDEDFKVSETKFYFRIWGNNIRLWAEAHLANGECIVELW